VDQLLAEIKRWVEVNGERVVERYEKNEFQYLDSFSDRTIDVSQPLAAILEVGYAESAELKTAQVDLRSAILASREEQDDPSAVDHMVLRALAKLARDEDPLVGNPTELVQRCAELTETIDHLSLGALLRRYQFKSKSVRIGNENPKQRYSLSKAELDELVLRFAGGEPNPEERVEREAKDEPDE
jgi:hypothetical protein